MGAVVAFDVKFDGTGMTLNQIRKEVVRRGWYGMSFCIDDYKKSGKLIVQRRTPRSFR